MHWSYVYCTNPSILNYIAFSPTYPYLTFWNWILVRIFLYLLRLSDANMCIYAIIAPDSGLLPVWCQATIWTNVGL